MSRATFGVGSVVAVFLVAVVVVIVLCVLYL